MVRVTGQHLRDLPGFLRAPRSAALKRIAQFGRWLDRVVTDIHRGVIGGFDKLWYG